MSQMTGSIISQTRPSDNAITANSVCNWSGSNVGSITATTIAGTLLIAGVSKDGTNASASSPPNYYAKVTQSGIVQCRTITGTALAIGDLLKVGDTAGRVAKATIAAAGAGTLTGIVGVVQSAIASGDATDTLVDVLLTPGLQLYV